MDEVRRQAAKDAAAERVDREVMVPVHFGGEEQWSPGIREIMLAQPLNPLKKLAFAVMPARKHE